MDILCDPLCGASLLIPLFPGTFQPSLDNIPPEKLDEIFVTVPPESLKPKRKISTTATMQRRKSTRRGSSSGSAGSSKTSALMEQSDAVIEQAMTMMKLTQNTENLGEPTDESIKL